MPKPTRISSIDALRGFALAGIVVVHIVEQYAGAALPTEVMESARLGWPDSLVDGFIQLLLRGKFFALFSILFGLSFFIQFDNAQRREVDYKGRYLWRIFLLFVIGYVHHCIYRGDILTIYALLAPFLIFFLPLKNKWLWTAIAVVFLGIPRMLLFSLPEGIPMLTTVDTNPDSARVADYWQALKYGTFTDVALLNAVDGFKMKMEFQLGVFYRFYLTFAFFLMGIWLGRIGYFEKPEAFRKQNKRVLIGSIIGFFVCGALTGLAFMQMGGEFSLNNPWAVMGLHMADLANLFITFIILISFVLIYQRGWGQKILNVFTDYGRTALTNYVLQSVVGTAILYGWGLGQIGEWRNIHLFVLSIVIIGIQVVLSTLWLKKFRYGPLEWLWRSATYFKKV